MGVRPRGRALNLIAILLALVFTVTLLLSTLILPPVLNEYLKGVFRDSWPLIEENLELVERLRPVGYACFAATIALIVLGFALGRHKISVLGSMALYLPTFSYFAATMFFLAGIGVLRVLWLPIIDASPGGSIWEKVYAASSILMLGDVVYLPYDALRALTAALTGYPLDNALFTALIMSSSAIFFAAAATWLKARFSGVGLVKTGVYRYSRHPQYTAFLLWSYGLLVYDRYLAAFPRGGFFSPPPLVWLVFAMCIIGVALKEEAEMVSRMGDEYLKYRETTPFMVPLPKILSRIITYPARVVSGEAIPSNGKGIAAVLLIYTLALVALSAVY